MLPKLQEVIDKIIPADQNIADQAKQRLDTLTKPPGSLGRLEACAVKYAAAKEL